MPIAPRHDQFVLRGTFSERLTLPGPRASIYRFLVDAETLLPFVPGIARIVAHDAGAHRLVFAPVGAGGLSFTLELEVRVTGDGDRTVTLASIPTDSPPIEPKGILGDFTAILRLTEQDGRTIIDGDATLAAVDTIPPSLRRLPKFLLEKTTALAVGKQMETIGRDLMRNIAAAYPSWHAEHPE